MMLPLSNEKNIGSSMAKEKQPLMTEEFWAWFDAVRRERDLSDAAVA